MSKAVRIKKGLDIRLKGAAEQVLSTPEMSEVFSIQPSDFHGLTPKLKVREGERVHAGDVLFTDKSDERLCVVSPVSGEIAEVIRGERRRILEVRILADKEVKHKPFGDFNVAASTKEQIIAHLLKTGAFAHIRQRPFSIVPNPDVAPKAIFISAFDSAPLAPDLDFLVHHQQQDFTKGLEVLAKLTSGKVHLNLKSGNAHDEAFTGAKGAQINTFKGPHPAGNVGVQIHHLEPISKGDYIWYVHAQDVALIGRVFSKGVYDATRIIALTGSRVKNPKYYKMHVGARLKNLFTTEAPGENLRYISGNPLTGKAIPSDGFLGFYDHQVTVLPEIHDDEFFLTKGWLSPGFSKFSASRTYPSWLLGKKSYDLTTGSNGEERAFVVTGQYEQVFPFSIFPVYLLKAIITNDIEKMEQLGIYEVDAEDFALCEFVCTSKISSQEIIRQGLDVVRKECF